MAQKIQTKATTLLVDADEVVKDAIARLFTYMGVYWVAGQTPERFCVNGDCHRTNNDVDPFNHYFNEICGKFHHNFWSFTSKTVYTLYIILNGYLYNHVSTGNLQLVEDNFSRDFQAVKRAGAIRRPRTITEIQSDSRISQISGELSTGRISDIEFLEIASNLFEPDRPDPTQVAGRPRNNLVMEPPEHLRRRGRPRRIISVTETQQPVHPVNAEEQQPRRRGRPRRISPPPVPEQPNNHPVNVDAQQTVHPVNVDGQMPVHPVNADEQQPRRRGRPRRISPPPVPDQPNNNPVNADGQQPVHPVNADRQQPRRRGRPRRIVPVAINAAERPRSPVNDNVATCNVCLTNPKNRVCLPCGHLFCHECCLRVENCFLCRQPVLQIFN